MILDFVSNAADPSVFIVRQHQVNSGGSGSFPDLNDLAKEKQQNEPES